MKTDDLPTDEALIYRMLPVDNGPVDARITSLELSEQTGFHRSYVRAVIRRLVVRYGRQVCSDMKGYWRPVDKASFDRSQKILWNRAVAILTRYARNRDANVDTLLVRLKEQLTLRLAGPEKRSEGKTNSQGRLL